MPSYKPIFERFSEKYQVNEETGCWDWKGTKVGLGYGMISGERGTGGIVASRFSYEHFVGPIPEGMVVRHRCDNPGCVNPDHLVLGSHQDNMNDMVKRGRGRILDAEQAAEATRMHESGETFAAVARVFGVNINTIRRTVARAKDGDTGGIGRESKDRKYTILSREQRRMVESLVGQGFSIMQVAKEFGVDRRTVRNILAGKLSVSESAADRAKISKADYDGIIELYDSGLSQAKIAKRFGVAQTTISRVVLSVRERASTLTRSNN